MRFLPIVLLTTIPSAVTAQITFGPACAAGGYSNNVLDPLTPGVLGTSGTFQLYIDFCSSPVGLQAVAMGAPTGYLDSSVGYEFVFFILAVGLPSVPGIPVFGGEFYIDPSISYNFGGVTSLVLPQLCGVGCGTQGNYNVGQMMDLTSLVPVTPTGVDITVQAVLVDLALYNFFTTQAVTFQR